MASRNRVSVAVIGAGGVGKHFLSQLSNLRKTYPQLALSVIARSKKCIYVQDFSKELEISSWEKDLSASQQAILDPEGILDLLAKAPGKSILVDNTSSLDVASTYPLFLKAGISVVTPNKKAFSDSYSRWQDVFSSAHSPSNPHGGFVYHESSVMAGLPIISTLNDLIATGDQVKRIEGVFSGTMSFLFNNFAPLSGQGGKWSEEVRKAKEAGFTEPDPRDDLNGVDVARKLVILARLAGLKVESVSGFPVQSLIPEELKAVESGEEFMERLGEFDGRMEEVKREAEKEGKVVRYVGCIDIEGGKLSVGVEEFEKGHPIAGLKGSDNMISFYTERYGSNPLVVQGAGAGGAVTAMGITADLIKVLQRIS